MKIYFSIYIMSYIYILEFYILEIYFIRTHYEQCELKTKSKLGK